VRCLLKTCFLLLVLGIAALMDWDMRAGSTFEGPMWRERPFYIKTIQMNDGQHRYRWKVWRTPWRTYRVPFSLIDDAEEKPA
jgi:hypothetical protein